MILVFTLNLIFLLLLLLKVIRFHLILQCFVQATYLFNIILPTILEAKNYKFYNTCYKTSEFLLAVAVVEVEICSGLGGLIFN